MRRAFAERSSLPLLNAAVAFVVVIPILLIAMSVVRENIGLRTDGPDTSHDQPPIILLRESDGYSFESGSAALSEEFQRKLRDVVIPALRRNMQQYQCDIIEVVGHTDSQPVSALSNLDGELLAFVQGNDAPMSPGSNADLGLMRAWSLIRFLQTNEPWQAAVKFYGYSAGQAINQNGTLVGVNAPAVDAQRRRIEIRVRRSK